MAARKTKTENTPVPAAPKVLDSALEDIIADRFSRYSKYIIQERALPDVRDGLKPVQRRILWAMYEDGNTYNKPYRKSAKTVGNVIGNYHPHGDSSVYDAIVRMSQSWKSRLPLIDMQGNNGSIDDDPAAAMRYTEARLSRIADWLMEDIDKDTVEWAMNFSDEKQEPTVLPARYPNLLVNGITGIAAGYATNIPPHNFNETLKAAIYRLQNPDCTLDELMEIIPGPDFPTGGIIMGKEGIKNAFETGKGKIIIRSKAEIEETRTINRIVITEIPYEVVKSALVKRMDEIRLNQKVNGILDVRDESDRNGLRIVCDLKKEANAQAILNYLYKNTDLQVSYHYNVVAIVKKAPKLLGLREMLDAFLEHREQVVLARTRYDLAASKKREHIVDGLIQALSILDQVIAVIRKSANKSDARNNLMDQFGFTHEQAEAIITLQLYRLSNTDINALKKEAKELAAKIKKLEGILTSKTKRKNLMIQELQELLEAEPTPRLSQIEEQVEEIVIDQRDMIADEPVMLVASEQGYIKKVSMRSFSSSQNQPAGKKEGDWIVLQQQVSTLDTLLLFTDRGRFAQIPVYELDEAKWKESGTHFSTWFKTDSQEKITAAFVERNPSQNLDLLLASAKGMVKRIEREQLPPKRGMRMTAVMSLFASDRMAAVAPLSHEQDIVLASREGLSFALDSSQVSTSSLKTRGVRGMNLAENDELIFAGPVSESLIIEDDGGRLKRIAADQIGKLNRPAKGARLFKAVKSRPCTLSYAAAADEKTEIAFQDEDQSKVAVSSLSKMAPSSTWPASSPLPTCAPALPFEQRLQSGTIERKMPDKQLTLFGDQ